MLRLYTREMTTVNVALEHGLSWVPCAAKHEVRSVIEAWREQYNCIPA